MLKQGNYDDTRRGDLRGLLRIAFVAVTSPIVLKHTYTLQI